jgi:hypothetical protein
VVLPTLKYATQKHYRYMLDVHLIPAFGKRQIRDITREELQGFLSRKLGGGPSWETVHHFKCGLSNSWCGRGLGLHRRESRAENQTSTAAVRPAASGTHRLSDTGPGCFAG